MAIGSNLSVEVVYRADGAGEPSYWANRYEATASLGGTFTDLSVIADAFQAFAVNMLVEPFWVDHIVISSYEKDGEPYNPDNLYVQPVGLRGARSFGTGVLPLTNVLHIRKTVARGRVGHLFLRGYLTEDDIISDQLSGVVRLSSPTVVQTAVSTSFANLQTALGAGNSLALISGPGAGTNVREVDGMIVAGLSIRNMRTQRKSRIVANSLESLTDILADGIVGVEEIGPLVLAVGNVVKALGTTLPPLLP